MLTLREGPTFHDGEPVRARLAACIRRWGRGTPTARPSPPHELSAPTTAPPPPPAPPLPAAASGARQGLLPPACDHARAPRPTPTRPCALTEIVGSGPYRFAPRSACPARASSTQASKPTCRAGGPPPHRRPQALHIERARMAHPARPRDHRRRPAAGRGRLAGICRATTASPSCPPPGRQGQARGGRSVATPAPQPPAPALQQPGIRRALLRALSSRLHDRRLWRRPQPLDGIGCFLAGTPIANTRASSCCAGRAT